MPDARLLLVPLMLLVVASVAGGKETSDEEKSAVTAAADEQWGQLEALIRGHDQPGRITVEREVARRAYRERGLDFYDAFADDRRRWEWLLRTVKYPPRYWMDLAGAAKMEDSQKLDELKIDQFAQARWDRLVQKTLLPEFLASSQPTGAQRTEWYRIELVRCYNENIRRIRRGQRPDVESYLTALLAHAARLEASDGDVSSSVVQLNYFLRESGVGLGGRAPFVAKLRASPSTLLQRLADGMQRALDLREKPLDLQLTSLNGGKIDVSKWRGKVVLVDIWSTGCSTCIDSMPGIRDVYERYHDRGFEVVGIALDEEESRQKVEEILHRLAIPWPSAMQSWNRGELRERFGIVAVPFYFLLDQDGKLVTTDIGYGKSLELEEQVRSLLATKPIQVSAARTARRCRGIRSGNSLVQRRCDRSEDRALMQRLPPAMRPVAGSCRAG